MRYRIGEETQNLENLGDPVGGELVTFSVFLGLIMGVGFVVAGLRGKQIWLLSWGAGLVISSLLYIGADFMGYT